MEINLFDEDFRHIPFSVHGKISKKIKYSRDNKVWDGITLFTGRYLSSEIPKMVQSRYKFAWILECREFSDLPYRSVEASIDLYDKILTHDDELISKFPEKCVKVPFGGCWIDESNYKVSEKSKNFSMIYSEKNFLTGHKLRHLAADKLKTTVDLYGKGCSNLIVDKAEALDDYRFSIVIENSKAKNYFTEKLLDCFAVGTIPIYWGAPNIGDYFNTGGIVVVNNIQEIQDAVYNLDESSYVERKASVLDNFELFREYAITEDWMYDNVFKEYDKAC